MRPAPTPTRRLAAAVLLAGVIVGIAAAGGTMSDVPPVRHGDPTPPARTPGAIRVATYNVLNLFDPFDDPALGGRWDDLPNATDERRCRNIAAMIRRIDADIIALQEVESLECLRWFRDTFLADMGYDHMASEDVGYFRGVESSVLSRFPIEEVTIWPNQSLEDVDRDGPGFTPLPDDRDTPTTYQRSPMRVDVRVSDDYALTLFVLHHKAGRSFGWMREMEALRTVEKLTAIADAEPDRNVIVLGDFNAAPWDRSLRLYLEAGFVDSLAHRAMPRTDGADESELAEARLYKTHDSGRVIDYVLLNAAAYAELVVGSAHVVGKPFDPEYDRRRNDPEPAWFAADHHPVVVDLRPTDAR
jgi:endonuclease/exonuclease/phosphatase family metal-dependent hydrolase